MRFPLAFLALMIGIAFAPQVLAQSDDPQLIFKKSTVFRLLSPDAKLAVYAIDDPGVEGVACHFTVPEIGGWKGWAGLARGTFRGLGLSSGRAGDHQGEVRAGPRDLPAAPALFFKKMQIVRGCVPSATCWSIWFSRTG